MILDAYLAAVHVEHQRLGFRSGNCVRCQAIPVAWHDRARAHQLPALVVGGIPLDSPVESRRVEAPPGFRVAAPAGRREVAPAGRPG